MTVSTAYAPLTYNGNGVTTAFSVTWPFFTGTLVVTAIDADGVETVKTITTHYTVSGGTDAEGLPATGTVTMLVAPANGTQLRITRSTAQTQVSTWSENDSFPQATVEAALDKLTLLAQERAYVANGVSMQLVTSGATDYWDADDYLISNVADPEDGQDAATKAYVDGIAFGTTVTPFAGTLLDDADASEALGTLGFSSDAKGLTAAADYAAMRALLDLEPGTDVQAYDAQLADIAGITYAQGDILYHNGSNLVKLGAGTNGYFLKTQGASANPEWASIPGGGDLLSTNNLSDITDASAGRTNLGLVIGTDVQAYDADTLKADTADVLTTGFATTPHNAGTKSSGTFTPVYSDGNFQYAVNGGAHTLAPPATDCNLVIQYTNNGSAGAITTSGFTRVTGAFTTVNGDDFFAFITRNNGFSSLMVLALQ